MGILWRCQQWILRPVSKSPQSEGSARHQPWPLCRVQEGLLDVGSVLFCSLVVLRFISQEAPYGANQRRMGPRVGLAEAPEPLWFPPLTKCESM